MSIFLHKLRDFFSHPRSRAIGLVFAADGMLYGAWSALIPFIKTKFGLDEAELGMLLFSLPLGITVANPLAVLMMRRFGMQRTIVVTLSVVAFCFALPLMMPVIWGVALSLVTAGLFFSILNVSMNTGATALEHQEKIRIMSTCHGMWSFGAMSGSALASTCTGFGMTPFLFMIGVATAVFLLVMGLRNTIAGIEEEPRVEGAPGATFIWPNGLLWGLIILSLCTNLAEGTMADWAAVYMRDVVSAPIWLIGWGFAAYAFFMAFGRLTGDVLLQRHGARLVLQLGGGVVAAGLLLSVLIPNVAGTLLGFAMVGAGVSLGAPVLYGSAARAPGMAPGAGLATMNTFAMTGFLAGPAFIGFIARATSLQIAFTLVAGTALFWCWKAGRAKGLATYD